MDGVAPSVRGVAIFMAWLVFGVAGPILRPFVASMLSHGVFAGFSDECARRTGNFRVERMLERGVNVEILGAFEKPSFHTLVRWLAAYAVRVFQFNRGGSLSIVIGHSF